MRTDRTNHVQENRHDHAEAIVKACLSATAAVTGVPEKVLRNRKPWPGAVGARHIVRAACWEFGLSSKTVGEHLACDHTTVLYANRAADKKLVEQVYEEAAVTVHAKTRPPSPEVTERRLQAAVAKALSEVVAELSVASAKLTRAGLVRARAAVDDMFAQAAAARAQADPESSNTCAVQVTVLGTTRHVVLVAAGREGSKRWSLLCFGEDLATCM